MEFLRSKVIEVENWERSLSSSSQSEAQRLTRNEEARYEAEWIKGKKVLDVGCGGGLLSEVRSSHEVAIKQATTDHLLIWFQSLARLGASVTGIDATSTNISIAQHHSSQDPFFTPDRLTYQHCAAEDLLASHAASFDIVASVEVLEHVSEPASFLQSLNKLLKPGGHLLLSTISRTPLAWLLTIGMAENVLGLVSKGTHSYEKYIKSSELVEFIRKPAEQGGLGWTLEAHRVGAKERTAQARQSDAFGPLDPLPSSSLTLETRGIIYNPLVSDWKLLDRHSTLQKSGWGEECNYLLWARKPERGS